MKKTITKIITLLLLVFTLTACTTTTTDYRKIFNSVTEKIPVQGITENIEFVKEYDGYQIEWKSNKLETITNEGVVTRGEEDVVVELSITIKKDGKSETFILEVKVLKIEEKEKYTVTFKDYDGTVLLEFEVEKGQAAIAPKDPTREGYTFTGWDKDFSNVEANIEVIAQYELNKVSGKNTIAEILASDAGEYEAKGLVVAINAQSFVLQDETGLILVYNGTEWATEIKLGDLVTVKGATSVYGNAMQFGKGATYEVTGNQEVTNPEAKELTIEELDQYATLNPITIKYGKITGTLTVSNGKYFNVNVEGATTIGSITYPIDVDAVKALDGKKIEVEGYITGFTGGKYVNFVATSVKEVKEPDQPKPPVEGFSKVSEVQEATDGTEVKVKGIVTYVYKDGFYVKDDTASIYVYLGSGNVPTVVVGDEVEVSGAKGFYNGPQIATPEVTKVGSSEFKYQASEMTMEDLAALEVANNLYGTFAKVEFTVVANGDYINAGYGDEGKNLQLYNTSAALEVLKPLVGGVVEADVVLYAYKNGWRLFPVVESIKVVKEPNPDKPEPPVIEDVEGIGYSLDFAELANKTTFANWSTAEKYQGITAIGNPGQCYGGYAGFGRSGDPDSTIITRNLIFTAFFKVTMEVKGNSSKGSMEGSYFLVKALDKDGNVIATGVVLSDTAELSTVGDTKGILAPDADSTVVFAFGEAQFEAGKTFADVTNIAVNYVKTTGNMGWKSISIAALDGEEFPEQPEQPEPPVIGNNKTIAEILASDAGEYEAKGLVVAINAQSFVLQDETGLILVYNGTEWATEVKLGDLVTVKGATSVYGNAVQFGKGATYEVTGNQEVTNPEAKELTIEELNEYATLNPITIKYGKITGTLTVSNGKYFNVNIEGATVIGSVSYPIDVDAMAALDGKKIEVEGYITGFTGGKYVNFVATSVKEVEEPDQPEPPLGDTKVAVKLEVSDLVDGKVIIIAYETEDAKVAMGSQSGKYRSQVEFNPEAVTEDVALVTLEQADKGFLLKVSDGYLYYIGSGNTVNTAADLSEVNDNYYWTFSSDDSGKIVLTNVGAPERLLQYNASSPRFACYKGTLLNLAIYAIDDNK